MDGNKPLKLIITLSLLASVSRAQIENDEDFALPVAPTITSPTPGPTPSPSNEEAGKAVQNPLPQQKRNQMANAGIEDITSANFGESIESFDFPNADIADVVKAISELTGKNFIIDPQIRGKITIIAPTRITVAEAYKAFLSALAINGIAVVPSGGFYKIRPVKVAAKDGVETYSGAYYPSADQLITRIFHLKYISAEAVNRDLKSLFQSNNGEMNPFTGTNSLIVSDYGSNIDRIQRIINALDVPGFEEQLEVMAVKFAKAKDISELVNKILNKGENRNQPGGGFVAGMPRGSQGARGSQGGAYFMVIPDDRTNSLIVSGNKAGIDRIRKLLKQLDFRLNPEDGGGFYVYNVRHGDAEKIAQTLQGVIKDATPRAGQGGAPVNPIISPIGGVQQPATEVFFGDVKVQADKSTNSLVIVASKPDYETMQTLLAQLDRPRDQVFVETVIMEMQASDALDWQVGGFQFQGNNGVKAGFSTLDPQKLGDLLSPTGGSGAIIPFGSSAPLQITQLNGQTVTVPSTIGFINFLKKNANANVLSTPQILALDNQEAMIEVGDKIVVRSSTQTTQFGSTVTPEFDDATISLKLTPSISTGTDSIRLSIDGSIKQASAAVTPSAFKDNTQPLATRKIKTFIVVPNQATAVLGGLMKDDNIEKISKVPLLGDIPILGWLFKSKSTQVVKSNLMIFLTPKIIRNVTDQKNLLSKKLEDRLKYIKKSGGVDPYGEVMDEMQKNNDMYSRSPEATGAPAVEPKKDEVPELPSEPLEEQTEEIPSQVQ